MGAQIWKRLDRRRLVILAFVGSAVGLGSILMAQVATRAGRSENTCDALSPTAQHRQQKIWSKLGPGNPVAALKPTDGPRRLPPVGDYANAQRLEAQRFSAPIAASPLPKPGPPRGDLPANVPQSSQALASVIVSVLGLPIEQYTDTHRLVSHYEASDLVAANGMARQALFVVDPNAPTSAATARAFGAVKEPAPLER